MPNVRSNPILNTSCVAEADPGFYGSQPTC